MTVRSRDVSKLDKTLGPILLIVGFILALIVGYGVLPPLLYETIEQPLQFSHAVHAGEEAGLVCEDCHEFRDDGTFAGIPGTGSCADCHEDLIGESKGEKALLEKYIKPGVEIPWLVYSRQPDNVFFPHGAHIKTAKIECSHCHGNHGETQTLRSFQRNRLTDYSRDIWGAQITGIKSNSWDRMKMDDCVACHRERNVKDSCMMCHK